MKKYKVKPGRPKKRMNMVVELLAWHVVNLARKYSLDWQLPSNKKGVAERDFDATKFPPLDLAGRLLTMAVKRADLYVHQALKSGAIGKRDTLRIRGTIDALRAPPNLVIVKALRDEKMISHNHVC